jgi:hypothetical protein
LLYPCSSRIDATFPNGESERMAKAPSRASRRAIAARRLPPRDRRKIAYAMKAPTLNQAPRSSENVRGAMDTARRARRATLANLDRANSIAAMAKGKVSANMDPHWFV